jgi:hypothetical protein
MNIEEIAYYADKITHANQRTIITFHNGDQIVGFFNTDPERTSNQWSFTQFYSETGGENVTTIDGKDIKTIEILKIY